MSWIRGWGRVVGTGGICLVAPVQGPQTGGPGVVQSGDWEAGPVGSDILAPGLPAFANGQMPWGDFAFDADLAAS